MTTHSRFIAELLDRKGTHRQGSIFLKKFVNYFNIGPFDTESSQVIVEHFIGNLGAGLMGGRIDIFIVDKARRVILIENKIYAIEQADQLKRYHTAYPDGKILYLTLFGENSKQASSLDLGYQPISYEVDILNWLEACKKEVVNIPVLKEAIGQYVYLLRKLTNQNTNTEMTEKIIELVLDSPESLSAYKALVGIEKDLKPELIKRILVEWKKKLQEEGFSIIKTFDFNMDRGVLISFQNPALIQRNLALELSFEGARYSNLIFGFRKTDQSEFPDALLAEFQKKFVNAKASKKYPVYVSYTKYRNWHYVDLNNIYFEFSLFYDDFKGEVDALLSIVNEYIKQAALDDINI